MNTTRRAKNEISTFLALTFALSSVPYYLILSSGSLSAGAGLYPVALMWCPGLAALATSLMFRKNLRGLGWGWGRSRYQLSAYLLPLGYALLAYGAVWLSGLGGIDSTFERNWLQWLLVGTAFGCFASLGEEIGWRGFLVGRLAEITGFTQVALISGAVWALWHLPLILFADYNAGTSGWYSALCFTLMAMAISFAFAWLRLKSGSLWTAVFMHTSHNFWIQGFFDPITTDTGITRYLTGEFGAALVIVALGVAFLFWKRRFLLP